jgi:LPXTG-motif cell wall-anchored protein
MMAEYGVNWLLMGIGLILMVGPWIYYFARRKKGNDDQSNQGKETDRD